MTAPISMTAQRVPQCQCKYSGLSVGGREGLQLSIVEKVGIYKKSVNHNYKLPINDFCNYLNLFYFQMNDFVRRA